MTENKAQATKETENKAQATSEFLQVQQVQEVQEVNEKTKQYLKNRGFNDETIKKYFACVLVKNGIIKGVQKYVKHKTQFYYLDTDSTTKIKISDISKDSYHRKETGKKTIYLNLKKTIQEINKDQEKEKNIFIVEGEADCLTLLQLGFLAISTSGTSGVNKVITELLTSINSSKHKIINLLDNDTAGEQATNELKELLNSYQINYFTCRNILKDSNTKDINELLQLQGETATKEAIKKALEKLQAQPPKPPKTNELKRLKAIQKQQEEAEQEATTSDEQEKEQINNIINKYNIFINILQITINEHEQTQANLLINLNHFENIKIKMETLTDFKQFNNFIQSYLFGTVKILNKSEHLEIIQATFKKFKNIKRLQEKNFFGFIETNNNTIKFYNGYNIKNFTFSEDSQNYFMQEIEQYNNLNHKEILKNLFSFSNIEFLAVIFATVGGCWLSYHLQKLNFNIPITQIIGNPATGKTSTIKTVLNPLILIDSKNNNVIDLNQTTKFIIQKNLSSSNLQPIILDEFKSDNILFLEVQKIIKAKYDLNSIEKGTAKQTVNSYKPTAPLIVIGETGTTDKATTERTLLYFNTNKPNETQKEAFQQLIKNKNLLYSIGYKLKESAEKKQLEEIKNDYFNYFKTDIIKNLALDERQKNNIIINLICANFVLDNLEISETAKEKNKNKLFEVLKNLYIKNNNTNEIKTPLAVVLEAINTACNFSEQIKNFIINKQDKSEFIYLNNMSLFGELEAIKQTKKINFNLNRLEFVKHLKAEEIATAENKTIRHNGEKFQAIEIIKNKLFEYSENNKIDIYNIAGEKPTQATNKIIELEFSQEDLKIIKDF